MDEATRNQMIAADPGRSTWLTANAGSGKTRVLTDRVARLLLRGCAPERILCLTYTKAAATEMQNRLLKRLGKWAMLPDAPLREELAELGEAEGNGADLAQARRLFARAIEAPGGLKVQTIHSFCGGVLRRFPIEAGVPLGFAELDDRSAVALRAGIVEEMAEEGHPAVDDLVALVSGNDLDGFLAGLSAADYPAPPDAEAIRAVLGLPSGFDEAALRAQVFLGDEGCLIPRFIADITGTGKNNDRDAGALRGGDWSAPGLAEIAMAERAFLLSSEPFTAKIGKVPTKPLQNGACAAYMDQLNDLMRRVEAARPLRLGLLAAGRTLALHRFAHAFTQRLEARKSAQGWLDFDDLIARTARLLSDSAMAQWVLFRLDGGIDHILVDEAQDTSPRQWQVIRRLTEEFTSGLGAQDRDRTLFVVGDPKQSIYSFQGADIAVFDEMKRHFADDFQAVQAPMQDRSLLHSFRSSPAILRLVDAVFQGAAAQGLGAVPPRHVAFHEALPGRVDIWPPLPRPEAPEPGDWWQPVDQPAENDANTVLARAIAAQIKAMLGQPIYDIHRHETRPIVPGDILILVQRRSALFHALIRACKGAELPVAGADRLKLGAELAVRDIRAVLDCLATPEDDLALAAALRSPLFGLSEDDLYRLAAGPRGYLIRALRDSPHAEARDILADLAAQADFLRPYDLISRLLIRHGGRARLLVRLGPEAEDGIAELMSQALVYERAETPSLTGFLVWLSGDDVEVKRQVGGAGAGAGGGLIRLMTVHGAKGLESPVVILPETMTRRPRHDAQVIAMDGQPVWRGGGQAERPPSVSDAVVQAAELAGEERRRLLYVGLTRAESWLIVAAAGETGSGLDSWHAMLCDAVPRAGLDQVQLTVPGVGEALRLSFGDWPDAVPGAAVAAAPAAPVAAGGHSPELPLWADQLVPVPPPAPRPVAATALGGAKVLGAQSGGDGKNGGDSGTDAAAAMLRGTRLHLLLEHLAGHPPARWDEMARAALAGAEGGLPDAARLADLMAEARAVLNAPELASVMTPDPQDRVLSEVECCAALPGLGPVQGIIDRLIVGPDHVLAVDYKSNADIPGRADQVPVGILRQMAVYRGALRAIYPGRAVGTAVLWTAAPALMRLPDAVLDTALAALDAALHQA